MIILKTIKDISRELGISTYAIRFYEKKGLLEIPRNENGTRVFDQNTENILAAIIHYRNVDMSIEDITTIFKNYHNHHISTQLLKEKKEELDIKINELEKTREYLEKKIKMHASIAELEDAMIEKK
ncbi:MerR family transcriptional regulator [Staphylococcus lugdunensis]|nr:MerR family transcriptional regulator [Staphylococcus lugdunensis]